MTALVVGMGPATSPALGGGDLHRPPLGSVLLIQEPQSTGDVSDGGQYSDLNSSEHHESLIVAEPQQAIASGGRAEAARRLVDHLREGIDW